MDIQFIHTLLKISFFEDRSVLWPVQQVKQLERVKLSVKNQKKKKNVLTVFEIVPFLYRLEWWPNQ